MVRLVVVPGSRAIADLAAGGAFVEGCPLALDATCELVIDRGDDVLALAARVVYVDGRGGVGLELVGFDAALRARVAEFLAGSPAPATGDDDELALTLAPVDEPELALELAPEPAPEPGPNAADPEPRACSDRQATPTKHEQLRGLTLAQQIKKASSPDPSERMMLERLYGKAVWEPLLRNPRLTTPEVTRIARMGSLPRPLIEIIVGNAAWLQIPEIRRALLANPRLAPDQITRVLRLMSKPELKLAAIQTAYPYAVRDAAKRMMTG